MNIATAPAKPAAAYPPNALAVWRGDTYAVLQATRALRQIRRDRREHWVHVSELAPYVPGALD